MLEYFKSHPTWVRGLKLRELAEKQRAAAVAPHVGAWIEIAPPTSAAPCPCRTPRGCVD